MTVRKVIEEIKKCGWVADSRLTNPHQKRWVFQHPHRHNRITVPGDLEDDLKPHAAGGIITEACDD